MVGVGAHGHTNPHLPVVAELVERGHRVSYAIPGSFAATVAATGAAPLVITSTLPDETRDEQWPDDALVGMGMFLDDAMPARVFPLTMRYLQSRRPRLARRSVFHVQSSRRRTHGRHRLNPHLRGHLHRRRGRRG
jgi:hypothetical protein